MDQEMKPQILVRRFTQEITEQVNSTSDTAIRVIIAEDCKKVEQRERQDAQWRKWFEPSRCTDRSEVDQDTLNTEAMQLKDAWAQFHNSLPSSEQPRFDGSAPTFEDVIRAMFNVADKWDKNRKDGKFGKISTAYRKCCKNIKSHETVLKILPEDKYCSLFTGVLRTLVHASTNHENIAASFLEAISEINECVAWCAEVVKFYPTEKMQVALMELYTLIFRFLNDVLRWYSQKRWIRVAKSFNEDLYEDFKGQIKLIREKAERIKKEGATLGQSGEIRIGRLNSERTLSNSERTLSNSERTLSMLQELHQMHYAQSEEVRLLKDADRRRTLALEAEQDARQRGLFDQIAKWMKGQLLEQATHALEQRFQPQLLSCEVNSRSSGRPNELELVQQPVKVPQPYRRRDILEASRDLEDFFNRDRIRIDFDPTAVWVPSAAVNRLKTWVTSENSSILSIAGPEFRHSLGPGPSTNLARGIVEFAAESKIPVVSYFCELCPRRSSVSPQSKTLVALTYAMIRQFLEIIPFELESIVNLTAERFEPLNGTYETMDTALELLEDIIRLGPPLLYCVIDGFEVLEDLSTAAPLRNIVALLERCTKREAESHPKVKVLLTTSGRSRCLLRSLSRDQLVLVDDADRSLLPPGDSQAMMF